VRWLLDADEEGDKHALLQAFYAVEGEKAEGLFRRLLVRRGVPEATKQEIMGLLKRMGAAEPYVALSEEGIVEAWVNVLEGKPAKMVGAVRDVEKHLAVGMRPYGREAFDEAVQIFRMCLFHAGGPIRIREPKSWAAALHYFWAHLHGETLTQRQVAALYGANPATVAKNLRWLRQRWKRENEEE